MSMGVNSVRLDGTVESCRMVGKVGDRSVAKLTVVTLHPREGAGKGPASESFVKASHVVRVVADEKDAGMFVSLSKDLRSERASNDPSLAVLHPCALEGVLRTIDDETFVDVESKHFSLTSQVSTSPDNNVARLDGTVRSFSFTDGSARLNIGTRQGDVSIFFSKGANPAGWNAVSSGAVRKGDRVSVSGPLVDGVFTDGKKTRREYYLSAKSFERLSLEKKQRPTGPSL